MRRTAQLVNIADGYQFWAERYDREMADVFDVQDVFRRLGLAAPRSQVRSG